MLFKTYTYILSSINFMIFSSPIQMLGLTNKSPVEAKMGASPKFMAKRAHPSPLR